MNETFYFLLTEHDDTRIGVVGAATNEELNAKVTLAINSHFDIETPTVINLDMEDYKYGDQGDFGVINNSTREDEDDEDNIDGIWIETIDLF